ncbi:site-specific integrase, partial [Cytobacillus firmus]
YIAFLLAASGGLRQGESLGLKWKNVSFKNNSIFITDTISHDGKTLRNTVKSRASKRIIGLPQEVMEALKKRYEEIQNEKKRSGSDYEDNNLVNCTSLGKPVNPRNLLRALYKIADNLNIEKISYHELRHTHATLLIKNGISHKVVSTRLGHSNVKTTLEVYSHILPSMETEAVNTLNNILFKG